MRNNPFNQNLQPLVPLFEGLKYKDLDGMMKSTMHVDEFAAKMGDDADIIVISFFVRDLQAAKDLVGWFEKGYDFVLDADRSPGEIKPSRYLVYLELRRRRSAPQHIQQLLEDLSTLTEFEPADWTMRYKDKNTDWSEDAFISQVPLSPEQYKQENEGDLNEMRTAAGLPVRKIYKPDPELRSWQSAAGI